MAQAETTKSAVRTDPEALEWLLRQPNQIETSVSELAREWGWNRSRTLRRLRRWADAGHIERQVTDNNRSLIVVRPAPDVCLGAGQPEIIDAGFHDVAPDHHSVQRGVHLNTARVSAVIIAALALSIGWFAVRINADFGASMGRNEEASRIFAGLSVVVDLIGLLLPAAAGSLWLDGNRYAASVAWSVWGGALVTSLLAASGFASVNIADTMGARHNIVEQRAALIENIGRLEAERALITEQRPAATINAEIASAQPMAVWSATKGCSEITRAKSAEQCAPVLTLRQSLGRAERREVVDGELQTARSMLAQLPAMTVGDPQADSTARMLRWVSGDLIKAQPADVGMIRLLVATVLPQTGGLVMMIAMALWRCGGARRRNASK